MSVTSSVPDFMLSETNRTSRLAFRLLPVSPPRSYRSTCLPCSRLFVPQDFLSTALRVPLGNETDCGEEEEPWPNEVWRQQQQQHQESSPAALHSAVASAGAVSSGSEMLQVFIWQETPLCYSVSVLPETKHALHVFCRCLDSFVQLLHFLLCGSQAEIHL